MEMSGKGQEIGVGVLLGMEEMGTLLGRWRMDEAEVRRRYLGNGSDGTRFGCWRRGERRAAVGRALGTMF